MKELNKRASGQAFEVILSPTTPDAKVEFPMSPNKKKETSLDEIKRKLEAAEERRRVSREFVAKNYHEFLNLHLLFLTKTSLCVRATRLKC